jgi:predicted RND superfamily exporter protein
MTREDSTTLEKIFRFIVARRWWVVTIYAVLLGPSVYFATRVTQDNSLDRLIIPTDPESVNNRAFEKVFGTGEYVVLVAEAPDPFAPAVLARVDELERRLEKVPRVSANSALSVFRRAHAGFEATPAEAEAFRKFATGTQLFRKQGLVGDNFLGIPLILAVHNAEERHDTVAAIDAATTDFETTPAPLTALRKVGQPYVNAYLDTNTRQAGGRYFPVFFLFVIVLNYALYRSFRALMAFIITLSVCAAMTVGFVGLTGGVFTIVSALVPMTVMITCMATLVYLHSRYVEMPEGSTPDEHQIFALCNKFLACTASVFATAVGFAALAVSKIRPIREMGIWVAIGLVFTWLAVFTLFPSLQKILNTPTMQERKVAGQWLTRLANWLPMFSYRWRWLLVPGSLALCVVGAIALFGAGPIEPMRLETNAVDYMPKTSRVYQDMKYLERLGMGLSVTEVWLTAPKAGQVSDAEVIGGLGHFADSLEADPQVKVVAGLPMILRSLRYVQGKGDQLPADAKGLEQVSNDLESLLPKEPMLQRFVDRSLQNTHLSVITQTVDYKSFVKLDNVLRQKWKEAVARDPALKSFEFRTAGLAPLQAKISFHLVPTLVESFGLTVAIIFGTFLLVFRSGAARLMAMIPSLFAILVMFFIMRVSGMSLNVATILIASTVLGTSENDQIHFFYHYLEKRKDDSTEAGLRHTLLIAGRAIIFATLINAGGFLGFALADLPPMRQFGILSSVAFVLSMIADFTALPAALWMISGGKPDAFKSPSRAAPPDDRSTPR